LRGVWPAVFLIGRSGQREREEEKNAGTADELAERYASLCAQFGTRPGPGVHFRCHPVTGDAELALSGTVALSSTDCLVLIEARRTLFPRILSMDHCPALIPTLRTVVDCPNMAFLRVLRVPRCGVGDDLPRVLRLRLGSVRS
jgi:hypothetical protein